MRNALIIGLALIAGSVYWWWADRKVTTVDVGLPMVQVSVPELSEKAKTGEEAFNANCVACHGPNASGKEGLGPPLIHIIYETGHHGDQAFYLAAKNGVRAHHWSFGDMPPVAGITDSELEQIVYYVRELQRANGIF